jgi:hypothetical protein
MQDSKTMRPLAGELLLAAWEEGAPEHDLGRALTMLATALPGMDREELGTLPIAERNVLLLRLHELSFGPWLSVFGVCARCGAQFEFTVHSAELISHVAAQSPGDRVTWTEDGRDYRLRAVTTDDLLATLGLPETDTAQDLLLARCLEVSPAISQAASPSVSQPVSPAAGQRAASPAVRKRFEQLNAASELSCSVDCPGCCSHELLDLDMARFLWTEVRNAARRLLGEIHQLASAYGWSQQAIAEMSAGRRGAYLEMLSA